MKRYVWINMNTGQFSNSWIEGEYSSSSAAPDLDTQIIDDAYARGWKLIEYRCVNDISFEFYDMMKITTNTQTTTK